MVSSARVALLATLALVATVRSANDYTSVKERMTFFVPFQYKDGASNACPIYFNPAHDRLKNRLLVSTTSPSYSETATPTAFSTSSTSAENHSHTFGAGGSQSQSNRNAGTWDWESQTFARQNSYSITWSTSDTRSFNFAYKYLWMCTATSTAASKGWQIPGDSLVYNYNHAGQSGARSCSDFGAGWSTAPATNGRLMVPSSAPITSPYTVTPGGTIGYHRHTWGPTGYPTPTMDCHGGDKGSIYAASLNTKYSDYSGSIPNAGILTCQASPSIRPTFRSPIPPPNVYVFIEASISCPTGWQDDFVDASRYLLYPSSSGSAGGTFGGTPNGNMYTSHYHDAYVSVDWGRHSDNCGTWGGSTYLEGYATGRWIGGNGENVWMPARTYRKCKPNYSQYCNMGCYGTNLLLVAAPSRPPTSIWNPTTGAWTTAAAALDYFTTIGCNKADHICWCTEAPTPSPTPPTKSPTTSPTKYPTAEPTSQGCDNRFYNPLNVLETDIDCGGPYCEKCGDSSRACCDKDDNACFISNPGRPVCSMLSSGGAPAPYYCSTNNDCLSGVCGPALPSPTPTPHPTGLTKMCNTPAPTLSPTISPTKSPSFSPTKNPTRSPTTPAPTQSPTSSAPTTSPTTSPTRSPTTPQPTESPTLPPVWQNLCNNPADTGNWTLANAGHTKFPLHLESCRLSCVLATGASAGSFDYLYCLYQCIEAKQPEFSFGCNVCMASFASCAYNKPEASVGCVDDPDVAPRPECEVCDGRCLADTDGYIAGQLSDSCIACAKRKCAGVVADCGLYRPEIFDMLCCTGWDAATFDLLQPLLVTPSSSPPVWNDAYTYAIIGAGALVGLVGLYAIKRRFSQGKEKDKLFKEFEEVKAKVNAGKTDVAKKEAKMDPENAKASVVAPAMGAGLPAIGGATAWTVPEDGPYVVPSAGRSLVTRFSFHGEHDDELDVPANAVLDVVERTGDWYVAKDKITGKTGLIPAEYVLEA